MGLLWQLLYSGWGGAMMSEYIPTLADIQNIYVVARRGTSPQDLTPLSKEFDRWLAAHDAEVWDRAKAATLDCVLGPEWDYFGRCCTRDGVTQR